MTTFKIPNSLCEFHSIGPDFSEHVFLNRDVEMWLLTFNINYVFYEDDEEGFSIDIENDRYAKVFEKYWL